MRATSHSRSIIWKTNVFGLAGFHTECTDHAGLATAWSTGDKQVPMFRNILAGGKAFNQASVELPAGDIVNVSDIHSGWSKPEAWLPYKFTPLYCSGQVLKTIIQKTKFKKYYMSL